MKTSFSEAKAVLERGGTYLTLDWPIREVLRAALDRDAKVVIGTARKNPEALLSLTSSSRTEQLMMPRLPRPWPTRTATLAAVDAADRWSSATQLPAPWLG